MERIYGEFMSQETINLTLVSVLNIGFYSNLFYPSGFSYKSPLSNVTPKKSNKTLITTVHNAVKQTNILG